MNESACGVDLLFNLHLGKVWILSNYLGDNKFCNVIIDHLLKQFDVTDSHATSAATATYICENTAEDSKLKAAICDMVAARMSFVQFAEHRKEYPLEVFVEMAARYATSQVLQTHAMLYSKRYIYHVHGEGEAACA